MALHSRSISAVLPDPTGPPMPIRSGPWLRLMLMSSWCPGPSKIILTKSFRVLRIRLVEIAQQAPALVEIDAVGFDLDRAIADLAFVRRGAAAAEIFPHCRGARRYTSRHRASDWSSQARPGFPRQGLAIWPRR